MIGQEPFSFNHAVYHEFWFLSGNCQIADQRAKLPIAAYKDVITAAVDKNQVEKLSGFSILAMAPDADHSLLSLKFDIVDYWLSSI